MGLFRRNNHVRESFSRQVAELAVTETADLSLPQGPFTWHLIGFNADTLDVMGHGAVLFPKVELVDGNVTFLLHTDTVSDRAGWWTHIASAARDDRGRVSMIDVTDMNNGERVWVDDRSTMDITVTLTIPTVERQYGMPELPPG